MSLRFFTILAHMRSITILISTNFSRCFKPFLRLSPSMCSVVKVYHLQGIVIPVHSPVNDPGVDLKKIMSILDQWIDFSAPVISEDLIDQFILQVVVIDDNTFNWTLDFSTDIPDAVRDLSPSEIAWQSSHAQRTNTPIDTVLDHHIANPQTLLTFTVTEQDAREYCQSIGMKFFAKKWEDKTVIISI